MSLVTINVTGDPEKLDRIIANQEIIMKELDDVKAKATELQKDATRMKDALGQVRTDLATATAKIDELSKADNLSDESKQTLADIGNILDGTDTMIEEQVPEVPAPAPATDTPAQS